MPENAPSDKSAAAPLAKEILAGAERRAQRLQKRAEQHAETIIRNAREEAERMVDEAIENARRRVEHEAQRILSGVSSEVRAVELSARQRVIDSIFEAAREKLAASGADVDVVVDLCVGAIEQMPGERFIIALAGRDSTDAGQICDSAAMALKKAGRSVSLSVDETPADITGGAIIRTGDGRAVFNNSFDARFERARDEFRAQIAEMIFTL